MRCSLVLSIIVAKMPPKYKTRQSRQRALRTYVRGRRAAYRTRGATQQRRALAQGYRWWYNLTPRQKQLFLSLIYQASKRRRYSRRR